jgi:adenylate kinase
MVVALKARMVFLGAPGAGKGTQAKMLCQDHDILHISTGDMLREQVAAGTDLGQQAKTFMDAGDLVPDDVIIGMVSHRISRPDAANAWILDGFPRTLPQAESLDAALLQSGQELSHIFFFQVPQDTLVERLTARSTCSSCGEIWNSQTKPPSQDGICDKCGGALTQRSDDRPDAVVARQEVYRSLTEPVLGYYRTKGLLTELDANRAPDNVLADLVRHLI